MQCLLFSSSKAPGYDYLEYPIKYLQALFGTSVKRVAFIPYAGVTTRDPSLSTFDSYERTVQSALARTGCEVVSVHHDPLEHSAVRTCDAIVAGGGNTFNLLRLVQETQLAPVLAERITQDAIPFIGWSAGANLACPSIRTTNDMPIVEPASMNALNLIPFQINPHYVDETRHDHFGETRDTRLREFVELNQQVPVIGLPEGMLLQINQDEAIYTGVFEKPCRLFQYGCEPRDLPAGTDLSFLLDRGGSPQTTQTETGQAASARQGQTAGKA